MKNDKLKAPYTMKQRFITRLRKMRAIDPKRFISYLVIIFLAVWLSLLAATKINTQKNLSALQSARSKLHATSSSIASLPTPNKIEKGQIDSALGYIIEESRNLAKKEVPPLPSVWQLTLMKPFDTNWRRDISGLDQIHKLDDRSKNLLLHHADTLEAIGQVLRYNPQADLSSEALSDNEIGNRIFAAREGISAAIDKLNKINPYAESDDYESLLSTLNELLVELESFDQSRDKNAWYSVVSAAQDEIIANRQSFWTMERDKLLTEYAETNQTLSNVIAEL